MVTAFNSGGLAKRVAKRLGQSEKPYNRGEDQNQTVSDIEAKVDWALEMGDQSSCIDALQQIKQMCVATKESPIDDHS